MTECLLQSILTVEMVERTLPNGCSRERAERKLADYDGKRKYGYKNQEIAAREAVVMATGMGVRDLRKWLKEN